MAHRWTVVICAVLALQFASEGVHGQDEEVPKDILDPSQNNQLWPIFEKSFDNPANTLGCDEPVLKQSDDTSISADGASYECDTSNVRKAAAVSYASKDISCSYSPLSFSSNGDNEQWVYADGALIGYTNIWGTTISSVVPSPTQVIAVKIVDYGSVGGLLGSFSDGTVTDNSWRCTDKFYDAWTAPGYDDSAWPAVTPSKQNGALPWGPISGVLPNAWWIWLGSSYASSNPAATVYCRKRINYCIPKPVDICTSYGYSYLPSSVICDGRKVKVVQLPQLHLFQSCDLVKCAGSDCKCNTCVTKKVNCNLLVYWNFGHFWSYRFCRVLVPGCCSAQCLTYS